jgi:hypothetical protein
MFDKFLRILSSFIAAMILFLPLAATAQFNASLSGTVEDTSGAIIPGATVVLLNTGTQQQFTATSSGSGVFRFEELPPANYKLTVTAKGFKQDDIDNINVVAEAPRSLDVKLTVGGDTQSVVVNADTIPELQNDDANISRTISNDEIERLPLFGADPYESLRTAPGITGDGARNGAGQAVFLPNNVGVGGSNSGIYQTENQPQISADGQRVADNNFLIDGVTVVSLTHGGAAVVSPNQESVQSISVTAVSYDAGDGRNSGAQIKVTTKSGTNQVHGSLFFLYDEPGLNAFNPYGGPVAGDVPSRVDIKQRTYAASIGGPIVKNKLFLFGSFQGYGQGNNTISAPTYVETSQYRAAVIANRPGGLSAATLAAPGIAPRINTTVASDCSDFANQQGTYVPTTVNGTGPVTQTAQSGPYCQVVTGGIDIGSLTPGGAAQLGQYLSAFTPTTTTTVGGVTMTVPGPSTMVGQGFVGGGLDGIPDLTQVQLNVPAHSRGNQFNGRIDYQATSRDLIAGNVYFTKLDNVTSSDPNSRHIGDVPDKPLNSAGTLIYIHTFSSAWLNEFRSNATRFGDNQPAAYGGENLGIPFTYVGNALPTGEVEYGVQGGATQPGIFAQNTFEGSDQVTHVLGAHTLKFGGGYRWEQDNDSLVGGVRPDFDFAGLWNLANDATFFESQTVNPSTGLAPDTAFHYRSQTFYTYVQHDWKVTPTFSFNAGIRYEIQTPWHRKAGAPSYEPSPGTGPGGPLIGLTLQPVTDLYNTDYAHFAPKVAFDWSPTAFNNRLVVRAGFATAYNHLDLSLFENIIQNGPNIASFGVCCGTSTLDFSTPNDGGEIDYVHGNGNNLYSFPANPAFATGIAPGGFPYPVGGGTPPQVGLYGVGGRIRNPVSYLFSLDTQMVLPGDLTFSVGYDGSVGRHYARLVNQNFLYPTSYTVGTVTTSTPAGSDFLAQTDSGQSYNSLNLRVVKRMHRGLEFDANYTYSKALDNITNGDQSDGSANQTDPANNAAEYGPSDNDVRNRVTGTVLYTTPTVHTSHGILNQALSGFQVNAVATWHSGFSWTPVINNSFTDIPDGNVVSPIRPIAFEPGVTANSIGRSCSNSAFETGSNFPNRGTGGTAGGTNYFSQAQPSATVPYIPIIGRNSLVGPCYRDVDLSVAKQVQFNVFGRNETLRFQANMFNAFNLLQLQPIVNEGFGTNITDPNFGKSEGADAGRVIEFLARLQF